MVLETKESSLQKFPTDPLLAQLAERENNDLEVVGSIQNGGNFLFWSSPSRLAGSCHKNNELCLMARRGTLLTELGLFREFYGIFSSDVKNIIFTWWGACEYLASGENAQIK